MITADTRKKLYPVIIAVLVVLVYATGFNGELVFDDEHTIAANPYLASPGGWFKAPAKSPLRDRPIAAATFRLSYLISEREPWGYHLVNIIIHLLAVLTLFGVMRRTLVTGKAGEILKKGAYPAALAAALLWGVHPLQTESVTYITQRCEALAGFFYLLVLYLVIRGSKSVREKGWYLAAVTICAAGMGSKATMVTAPLVVLIYDRVFLSSGLREIWRRRRWLYLGLFGSLLLQGWLLVSTDYPDIRTYGPLEYFRVQPAVVTHYLRLALLPDRLCLNYNWLPVVGWSQIVFPALLLIFLAALTIWALRRCLPAGFCGVWFFLTLAPTSSLFPLEDMAFEHRMYLPLAGLCALAGAWWWLGVSRLRRPWWGWMILAVALLLLSYRTVRRNFDYTDAEREEFTQVPETLVAYLRVDPYRWLM